MKILFFGGDLLCSFQCMNFILAPKRKQLKLSSIIHQFLPLCENDEIKPKFTLSFTLQSGTVLPGFRQIFFISFYVFLVQFFNM